MGRIPCYFPEMSNILRTQRNKFKYNMKITNSTNDYQETIETVKISKLVIPIYEKTNIHM